MKYCIAFFILISSSVSVHAQGFIAEIEADDIGVILNNPATVVLEKGDTLKGELKSASLINGYLKNVTLKMANGEKRKLQADEML